MAAVMAKEELGGFRDMAYKNMLLDTLNSFRMSDVLTDVTLIVREKQLRAHRVILSAASQVFAAMFQVDMRERKEGRVDLTSFQIKDSVVEELVEYLYTGNLKVSVENVEELLSASNFLMIRSLHDACCSFLEDALTPANCLGIAKVAIRYNCAHLIEKSKKVIQEQFLKIAENEEFLQLLPDDVYELIDNDDIEVTSENCVLKALMRWIENDVENRAQFFPSLLKGVRIQFLDEKLYFSLKASVKFPGFELCSSLMNEAAVAREALKSGEKMQVGNHICPRKCLDTTNVLFATGGYDGNHCLTSAFAFSFHHMKWGHCSPMLIPRHDHAVVVRGECLFVLGGFNSRNGPLSNVEVYNPIRDTWDHFAPMNSKRKSLCAAVLNSQLYVCGGLDENYNSLNTVEFYDQDTQQWRYCASMNEPRYSHSVVATEDSIFALGGWKIDSVEKFSGSSWQTLSPMLQPRAGANAVYRCGKIYIVGGHGDAICSATMEVYDISLDVWLSGVSSNLARWRAGSVLANDVLYIVGGRESTWQYLNVVESYNFDRNEWREESPLPFNMMGLRCHHIKVPKCKLKFFYTG